MPGSSIRSFPTIDTLLITSRPEPISVASLMGFVILPFSMRYASEEVKTNFPEAVSTCPPWKLTA